MVHPCIRTICQITPVGNKALTKTSFLQDIVVFQYKTDNTQGFSPITFLFISHGSTGGKKLVLSTLTRQ